jgi:hypothetical protein
MTSKSAPEAGFILIPDVGGDMLYPTCARLKECSCSFEPHTLYETARGLSRALLRRRCKVRSEVPNDRERSRAVWVSPGSDV